MTPVPKGWTSASSGWTFVIHILGRQAEVAGSIWVGNLCVGGTVVADGGLGQNPLVGGLC